MPLVPMTELLAHTIEHQYAIGYFEAWDSYSLEAVAEAAEAERSPVILGVGCVMVEETWMNKDGIAGLGCRGRHLAEQMTVPTALILNEAQTYEQALMGIDAGFNVVMLDTSGWTHEKATKRVADLVAVAHREGVAVEAELGRLPDALFDGGIDDSSASLTDPREAAEFVAATGIDCLGVSIGNVHILSDDVASVDLSLLQEIKQHVHVPLVIHGGTSFPPEAVAKAIEYGVAKFNVGTVLKNTLLDGIQKTVLGWPEKVNGHDVLGSHKDSDLMMAGKRQMQAKVRELIRLYGGSSRADSF